MASRLPTFPRVVFTIIEPISLFAGAIGTLIDPDWFIAEQAPLKGPLASSVNARAVTLQLGNLYLLLALIGIAVLQTTSEVRVVRNYIIALWIADIGHVAATYLALGEATFDVGQWNAMAWGNVGMTAFLCGTRSAWLLGLFGADKAPLVKAPTKTQ